MIPRPVPVALVTAAMATSQLAVPAVAVFATPSSAVAADSGKLYVGKPVKAFRWGPVQVRIRVKGKRIINVGAKAPMDKARTIKLNKKALPILRREALKKQSAKIDWVSGASDTSIAYKKSLQSAIDKAHL